MEILAGDNVGRCLRPALGHFHVFLAEDGRAVFVRSQGGASLTLHCVKRRLLPTSKIPPEDQTFPQAARCLLCRRISRREFSAQCLLHSCHLSLALSGVPSQARGTLPFYSSALGKGAALHFRVWAESSAIRFLGLVEGYSEKKPTARQPHSKCGANRPCIAAGWGLALTQ